MKIIINLFLLITLSYSLSCSAASCHLSGPVENNTITAPNIIIARDAPVGTILSEGYTITGGNNFIACNPATGRKAYITMAYSSTPSTMTNVFETNISGVGLKLAFSFNYEYFYYTLGPGVWNLVDYTGGFGGSSSVNYQLIKTGPITSGTLKSGLAGYMNADNGDLVENVYLNAGTVTALQCSISTKNISAPLGEVPISGFTGIGSTPKSYDFNVGLECDAGVNINVSLSGIQNSETDDASVLALTGAGSTDTADGIGVQVLYNGMPLVLNNNVMLKHTAGGQELLQFTARYYQVKSVVKGGKANATATLNITYQ